MVPAIPVDRVGSSGTEGEVMRLQKNQAGAGRMIDCSCLEEGVVSGAMSV